MALSAQSNTIMTVTQLTRSGSGQLDQTNVAFSWSGISHSSLQGILQLKLGTKIARKVLPGNVVVHQAMSAAWEPFVLKGEWRDVWMGQGEAKRTYLEFAKMVERLPLVRVVVDDQSLVGMIMDPEFGYHHEGWIDWSFTLSPETNETVSADQASGTGGPVLQKSVPQWFQEATDKTQGLHDSVDAASDLPLSTEDQLDAQNSLVEVDAAMVRITELSTAIGPTSDQVSDTTNVGTDITDTVWALPTCYERLQRAALAVGVVMAPQSADQALGYDDFILSLRFEQYAHQTTVRTWDLVGHAIDAARDMRSKSSQRPRAIHRARPGESLERISNFYYGTPDNADLIYRTNHLASIVLDGTEELLIPEVGA